MKETAQTTIEIALLICVVAVALVAMQAYFKGGLAGRIKTQADQFNEGGQYSPGITTATIAVNKHISENSDLTKKYYDAVAGEYVDSDVYGTDHRINENEITVINANATFQQNVVRDEYVNIIDKEPRRW